MNLDGKDPIIREELSEDELWENSQIVVNGKLTPYGEMLYEASKLEVYDEESGEWILV